MVELLSGIADRPITPHELNDVLKRVERRGHHETAVRLRSFAGRLFRYCAGHDGGETSRAWTRVQEAESKNLARGE